MNHGAFSALSGGNIAKGTLNGAVLGSLGGVASGVIQHEAFLSMLGNAPKLAQTDPIYFSGTLNEVVVKAPRLTTKYYMKSAGGVLGYANWGELGLSGTQLVMSYNRSRMPINYRVGTFASFSKTYSTVGKFAKGAGAVSNFGEGVGIYTNSVDYASGDLSLGRFAYRTTGSLTSMTAGAYAGSTMGPYGAVVGAGVGGVFSMGESLYDGVNLWINEMGRGFGSLQYNLSNSTPNIKFK